MCACLCVFLCVSECGYVRVCVCVCVCVREGCVCVQQLQCGIHMLSVRGRVCGCAPAGCGIQMS